MTPRISPGGGSFAAAIAVLPPLDQPKSTTPPGGVPGWAAIQAAAAYASCRRPPPGEMVRDGSLHCDPRARLVKLSGSTIACPAGTS